MHVENGGQADQQADLGRTTARTSEKLFSPSEPYTSSTLFNPSTLRDATTLVRPIRSNTRTRSSVSYPVHATFGGNLSSGGRAKAYGEYGHHGARFSADMSTRMEIMDAHRSMPSESKMSSDGFSNHPPTPPVPLHAAGTTGPLSNSELSNLSRNASDPLSTSSVFRVPTSSPSATLAIRALQSPSESYFANSTLNSLPLYRQPSPSTQEGGQASYPQQAPQDYPVVGSDPATTPFFSITSPRRGGWGAPPHHTQQGAVSPELSYSQSSLPLQNANLAELRASAGTGAPTPFFNSESGVSNVVAGNDGAGSHLMGIAGNFAQPTDQSNFQGQHRYPQQGGHGALGHSSVHRSQNYPSEQAEMDALAAQGHSSGWSSLPNQHLRGTQGDVTSSTFLQPMPPQERGKGHQSRARLQKHLRELQAEMVDLKERVRAAETLYHESSPPSGSAIGESQYKSRFGRGPMGDYEMKDAPGMSSSLDSNPYLNQPGFGSWRQELSFNIPPLSPGPSSSRSSLPGRRGTWRTSEAGNVLVFNTASSNDIDAQSATTGVEGTTVDERPPDEDEEGEGGEDSSKRYQCLVPGCFKTFTTSGHARRHSRTHLGHKLFVCPHEGCRSTFTRRDNCRQHQRARHRTTLPISEATETESLDDLIIDRQQEEDLQEEEEEQQEQQEQQDHQASSSSVRRHLFS